MANYVGVSVVAGSDSLFTIQAIMNGSPLPFNGSPALTPYVQVKSSPTAHDSSGELFTTSNGLTVTEAGSGVFTWALANSYTDNGNLFARCYVVNSVSDGPELIQGRARGELW
jgi:hypothetical protein